MDDDGGDDDGMVWSVSNEVRIRLRMIRLEPSQETVWKREERVRQAQKRNGQLTVTE